MPSPENLLDLTGKVALVTGGNRGIGKAIAEKFAQHGANVVISSTGSEQSRQSAHEVLQAIEGFGQEGLWFPGDISLEETGKGLVEQTVDKFKRLDILVHNAGINDDDLFMRLTGERWRRVIDTNLNSAFYVAQPALRQMQRQREGSVVFLSSVVAHGNRGQANYAASKAGLEGLMRSLALEYASPRKSIRVNAISAALVNTHMAQRLTDEQREHILSRTPIGRVIEPEEVANAALFLVSPMASAITGTIIDVDGGMLRR